MEIQDFPNYIIYEDGRCMSKARNKAIFLKPGSRREYLCYTLYNNGKCKTIDIHRLVAIHFIPNPNNFSQVNHKDCEKNNNHKDNLEWCTHLYNCQSYNKSEKVNRGYIVEIDGKRKTSYFGRVKINGVVYNTKYVESKEEAQNLINDIIKIKKNILKCL